MRAKHILLPIAAIALFGSYSVYTETQKAKFDSEIWKSAGYEDPKGVRVELLTPLMAHVLKFGMTVEELDDLLGQGAECVPVEMLMKSVHLMFSVITYCREKTLRQYR